MATHSNILVREIPWTEELEAAWYGCKELDMTGAIEHVHKCLTDEEINTLTTQPYIMLVMREKMKRGVPSSGSEGNRKIENEEKERIIKRGTDGRFRRETQI